MGRRSIEEIRKEEIILAFFQVISEKGIVGATIREIASIAKCNHGILRYYFGNKEGLIKCALEFLENICFTTLQNGLRSLDTSTEKIKYILHDFRLNNLDTQIHAHWFDIFAYSKTSPLISKALIEFYKEILSNIKDIIEIGIDSGEFRNMDLDVIANMILRYLEGALFITVGNINTVSHEAVDKEFAKIIIKNLIKD